MKRKMSRYMVVEQMLREGSTWRQIEQAMGISIATLQAEIRAHSEEKNYWRQIERGRENQKRFNENMTKGSVIIITETFSLIDMCQKGVGLDWNIVKIPEVCKNEILMLARFYDEARTIVSTIRNNDVKFVRVSKAAEMLTKHYDRWDSERSYKIAQTAVHQQLKGNIVHACLNERAQWSLEKILSAQDNNISIISV